MTNVSCILTNICHFLSLIEGAVGREMHFFHFRDLLSVVSGREVRGAGLLSRCSHDLFLGPILQN